MWKRPEWLRRPDWLRWPEIDLRDAHVYLGLTIATVGGMLISVAWTLVALGLFLACLGIFLPKRRGP